VLIVISASWIPGSIDTYESVGESNIISGRDGEVEHDSATSKRVSGQCPLDSENSMANRDYDSPFACLLTTLSSGILIGIISRKLQS